MQLFYPNKSGITGFTLIEILVVVAIVGILAAIAWPLFENQALKQRRSEAVDVLMQVNQQMQRCKTDSQNYLNCITTVTPSRNNTYSVAIPTVTGGGTEFLLIATKVAANDPECLTLTLDHLGRKGHTGTAPSARRCWGD